MHVNYNLLDKSSVFIRTFLFCLRRELQKSFSWSWHTDFPGAYICIPRRWKAGLPFGWRDVDKNLGSGRGPNAHLDVCTVKHFGSGTEVGFCLITVEGKRQIPDHVISDSHSQSTSWKAALCSKRYCSAVLGSWCFHLSVLFFEDNKMDCNFVSLTYLISQEISEVETVKGFDLFCSACFFLLQSSPGFTITVLVLCGSSLPTELDIHDSTVSTAQINWILSASPNLLLCCLFFHENSDGFTMILQHTSGSGWWQLSLNDINLYDVLISVSIVDWFVCLLENMWKIKMRSSLTETFLNWSAIFCGHICLCESRRVRQASNADGFGALDATRSRFLSAGGKQINRRTTGKQSARMSGCDIRFLAQAAVAGAS